MDAIRLILIFIFGNLCKSIHIKATTNSPRAFSSAIQSSVDAKSTKSTRNSSRVFSSTIQSSADAKNTEETSSITVSFQTTVFNKTISKILQLNPFCQAQNDKTESKDKAASWIAALSIGGILALMFVAIIIIVIWRCVNKPISVDPNWAGRCPMADGENPIEIAMDNKEPMQAKKRTSLAYIGSLPFMFQKSQCLLDDCSIQDESKENVDQMQSHNMGNGICQSNLRIDAESTTAKMNSMYVPPCPTAIISPNDHCHLTETVDSSSPPSDALDLSSAPSPILNSFYESNLQVPPNDFSALPAPPPPSDLLNPSSTDMHDTPNLLEQLKLSPPSNEPISNTYWTTINEQPPISSDLQPPSNSRLLPLPLCHQDEDQTELLPPPPPEFF